MQSNKKETMNDILERFVKGLQLYNTADSKQLLGYMREYGSSLNVDQKTLALMSVIIEKTDRAIQQDPSATRTFKSDMDLMDSIQKSTDTELGSITSELALDPSVSQVLEPFRDLKNQCKYYKYKYTHLNMVLIFIVSQFQQLFDATVNELSLGFVADMQSQKQVFGKFVELSKRLAKEAIPDSKERELIDELASRTNKVIDEKQKKTQERVNAIKLGSADEMLRGMLRQDGVRERLESILRER